MATSALLPEQLEQATIAKPTVDLDGDILRLASSNGCKQTVRPLLEKGTDPTTQGGLYGNALYAASSEGHVEIVRLLLEKGRGKSLMATYWPQFDADIAHLSGQVRYFLRRI